MAEKIIKSKLIQFYERDKKLVEVMEKQTEFNYNELIKKLLTSYLKLIEDK